MSSERTYGILNLFGLILNFAGALFLFYALAITSSRYRLVEKTDHTVAICLNSRLVATGYGGPLILTDEPCPEGIGPSNAAVVESEHPSLARWGLVLISLGFAMQLPVALRLPS